MSSGRHNELIINQTETQFVVNVLQFQVVHAGRHLCVTSALFAPLNFQTTQI